MEHTTKNQIFLKKGELLEITSRSVITVNSGLVWVTVAGDQKDYVLKSGEKLEITGAKPVIEAIRSSDIQVQEPGSKYKLFKLILEWNADVFN
ncbi:hypothetical protein CIK05_07350 [Bdellovibrio sp. qaytius]|nr:hypothetical protein CIK05_07350 [Bdellovibrio sp. qaytius]